MKGSIKEETKGAPLSVKQWTQNEKEIFIELQAGAGICDNDIELSATAQHCKFKLRDGRTWECTFYSEVDGNSCKYTTNPDGLIEIEINKLNSNQGEWPDLQRDSTAPDGDKVILTNAGSSDDNTKQQGDNNTEIDTEYIINHAKNSIFEKDDSTLNLTMYVKMINRETFDVEFQEEKIFIRFNTKDAQFLQLNASSTSDTTFKWPIIPKCPVVPDECTFKIMKSKVDFCLKKKDSARWGVLEKSSAAPAKSKGSSGGWIPLNSSSTRQKTVSKDKRGDSTPVPKGAAGGAKSVDVQGADGRAQKPTCAVPPLTLESNKPPSEPVAQYKKGFCGLDNLGNTCFMNSVLQVLANTRELKDYMLDNNVKDEINTDNPLGTGGHMVLSFAVLMRLLWSGKCRSYAPVNLKTVIASKASQFMGFAQHDAQEFMAFLLDGLHEDLNRIKEKPYTETVDSNGRPDEVVAAEAWQTHKMRNDSLIVDLFQGQYKSKLVCPECGKVSITFDPFMQVSVPLPKKKRFIQVIFFSKEHYKKPVKYLIPLEMDATVEELKAIMTQKTKVNGANMRVFEVSNSRVHKVFNRGSSLASISVHDTMFVCEVLSEKRVREGVVEVTVLQRLQVPPIQTRCAYSHCRKDCDRDCVLKRCTKCLRAAYCDQTCQKEHWPTHKLYCKRRPEPVGCPFVVSLPKSHATYGRLCQAMEAYARYSTNVFQPPVSPRSPTATPNKPFLPADQTKQTEPQSASATATITEHGQGEPGHNTRLSSSGSQESLETEVAISEASTEQGSEAGAAGGSIEAESETVSGGAAAADQDDLEMTDGAMGEEMKTSEGIATATVVGQPQLPERDMPPFFIKPVNMSGQGLPGPVGERIGDNGDEPIDLTLFDYVAMDWRNDPKQQNYVMAESKELEYDEDESLYQSIDNEKNITLDQCLQLFTRPEKLAPDEAWFCPQCKQHREASKEMSLWRLPSNFIVQLKRFSFKNMIWRDKIDKMVYYPTRGLDLSPYCPGYKGEVPPIYDLYGVINHHGGILGGHYTSYAKLPSREDYAKNDYDWRLFDDSHVTMASEKNVLTHSAYLLFYRRRQPCLPYLTRPLKPAATTAAPTAPTDGGGKPKAVIKGNKSKTRKQTSNETLSQQENKPQQQTSNKASGAGGKGTNSGRKNIPRATGTEDTKAAGATAFATPSATPSAMPCTMPSITPSAMPSATPSATPSVTPVAAAAPSDKSSTADSGSTQEDQKASCSYTNKSGGLGYTDMEDID